MSTTQWLLLVGGVIVVAAVAVTWYRTVRARRTYSTDWADPHRLPPAPPAAGDEAESELGEHMAKARQRDARFYSFGATLQRANYPNLAEYRESAYANRDVPCIDAGPYRVWIEKSGPAVT